MTRWLEPSELWALVDRDLKVTGDESPRDVIMREPHLLLRVPDPSLAPLDLDTYGVRLTRWRQGAGPRLAGMEEFMQVLTSLRAPACAVTVQGDQTSYTFLLDAGLSHALAGVAIDPPNAGDEP